MNQLTLLNLIQFRQSLVRVHYYLLNILAQIQIDQEIGRQIGFQQGICHVAANILQSVVADEQIYQFTEISMDELDAIKQEQVEKVNAQD